METVQGDGPALAGKEDAAASLVGIMATDAMLVQDRLNVSREVEDVGDSRNRCDFADGTFRGKQGACMWAWWCFDPVFVAADAADGFSGHHTEKTLHSFDCLILFIQGGENDRAVCG